MDHRKLMELLRSTIPVEELFDTYWFGRREGAFSMEKLCRENGFTEEDYDALLSEYLDSYPASNTFKHVKLHPFIVEWYRSTAALMGDEDCSEALFPPYIERDRAVELLKALHPREGVTKEQIAKALGLRGANHKSVQTDLRLLSPSLGGGSSYGDKCLRIGGHKVSVTVRAKRNSSRKKVFYTPNTVHPLILLENVSQVGVLLRALSRFYKYENSEISLTIGQDIWLQLSDYCRQRIEDVFVAGDSVLKEFLAMVETFRYNDHQLSFVSERQMMDAVNELSERLMIAAKGRLCRLTLYKDDDHLILENQKIQILKNNSYRAKPASGEGAAVTFTLDEVYDVELN